MVYLIIDSYTMTAFYYKSITLKYILIQQSSASRLLAPPHHLKSFNPDHESINYIELKKVFYTAPPAKLGFYPKRPIFYPYSTVYIPAPPYTSLFHQLNFRVNDYSPASIYFHTSKCSLYIML